MTRYMRDMIGYGAAQPQPEWPGGAKIAVQLVLNYEEGGENCILHGDTASEAFLSEIVGAEAWPGQRHWNMESLYEYGARAGFWRLYRLLRDFPVTVFGVATALARSPEQVSAMKRAGWEIASHGLKWIDYRDFAEADELGHMREAIRLHEEVVGMRPKGWYTGRCSVNTVRLAAVVGGFTYVADSYADDLPYWSHVGGRNQLLVPYTLDANDMRFATAQGFNSGEQFCCYLRDSFDALYAEGCAGAPKMLSVGLHCRIAGRPGRVGALQRFLEYAKGHPDVWFATRLEIAEHWRDRFPAVTRRCPSRMERGEFIKEFGSVFEHSPWVAGRAFDLELGAAHDTAGGLHNAFVRVFRGMSDAERLGVLQAHPDLAGKLQAAQRLTAESAAEQACAGLDVLTDDERSEFAKLNQAYTGKFGFPFIVAARDCTKAETIETFRMRLQKNREEEIAEACRQVERIAELRLGDLLPL